MARNISEQLREQLDQVPSHKLSRYFENIEDEMKRSRRRSASKQPMSRSEQVRFALSQGFYMQTCRWLQQGNQKDIGGIYLTIAEASFVKVDRQSNLKEQAHDYVVYTQLSGLAAATSQSSGNSQMGIMRMVSAIDVDWVAELLPKLKDPVDVDRLNSGAERPTTTARDHEETK